MKQVTALGLFSGGLDSILACRVIMAQGIRVLALKFVTPFFDDRLLDHEEFYRAEVRRKYGIDVRIEDLSRGYIELLRNPRHGYGRHFNPCIDCKIFMLRRARSLLADLGASFLITGEVLGQRPMSQRRDTLRVIERESGCEDILLRPLCAKRLQDTLPERQGLVDREKLYDFSGRGRRQQMELAAQFGITEYPSPAGGCMLTDPNLGKRIEQYYQGTFAMKNSELQPGDIRLLLVGRQFRLPGGYWFVLGRNQRENERITALAEKGDWVVKMITRAGPTGLLRRADRLLEGAAEKDVVCLQAAGLVVRYGKRQQGQLDPAEVRIDNGDEQQTVTAEPLEDSVFAGWQF